MKKTRNLRTLSGTDDLTGRVFGKWRVLSRGPRGTYGRSRWNCKCECGTESLLYATNLKVDTTSCGCKSRLRPYESSYNTFIRNAKRRELETDLTFEQYLDFIKEKQCHYCGAELFWPERNARGKLQGSNLDRKDNTKGYLHTNVVPCCWSCNNIKSNRFTYTQFVEIGKLLRAWNFPGSTKGFPSHVNCPYCPSQAYLQSISPVSTLLFYQCLCKHRCYISKESFK